MVLVPRGQLEMSADLVVVTTEGGGGGGMDAADQGGCPTPQKTQDAPNKKDPRVTRVGSSRLLFPV